MWATLRREMPTPTTLISGASGFIGATLCRRLQSESIPFCAIGRTRPSCLGADDLFRQVDLVNPPEELIPRGTQVVIHLAAFRGSTEDLLGHFRGTTAATMNLCDAARLAGVRRIVLASTTSVYEPKSPVQSTIREDEPRVRGRGPIYAYAKKWAEDAARVQCLVAQPPMELWTLRPGVVVGAQPPQSSWLGSVVAGLREGAPYELVGEHGHNVGLVALDDVVDALIRAAEAEAPAGTRAPGPVCNLVSEHWRERDIVELLAEALGVAACFTPQARRASSEEPDEPLSVAGDGSLWWNQISGQSPRPVRPLLEQAAAWLANH